MARHGPGLPLPQGLRVVGGAKGLTGWQVAAKKGHRQHVPLGTVQQVDSVQAAGQRGPSYQLLRVVQQAVLQPYGFRGQEVHLLPLVPDIITALHPEQQLLVADPPEGLLDMGRRDLLLSFLSQALLPYAPLARDRPAAAAAGLMAGARALTQVREMPTRQQLLDAGRADLVNLVMKVGGFTQAALQLGMRATRRPAGYWSSLEVLDVELDAFIAGCWVALPCPEDGDTDGEGRHQQQQPQQQQQQPPQPQDVYYYNTATKSIRWSLPDELQALLAPPHHHDAASHPADPAAAAASQPAAAVGDPGDTAAAAGLSPAAYQALLDLHEEPVMPPVSAITSAGRWDLHNAITRNGGYTAVAAELDRRLSRALPAELTTPEGLKAALKGVCWEEGWDPGALPTAQQLRDADRTDLVRAITQLGGWGAAAQAVGLTCAHSTSTAWHSWTLTDLAQELCDFITHHSSTHQPTGPTAASPEAAAAAAGEGSPSGSGNTASAAGSRQRLSSLLRRRKQQQQQAQDSTQQAGPQQQSPEQGQGGSGASGSLRLPSPQPTPKQQQQQGSLPYLPTQAQLLAAGRVDLVYALRQHGYEAVRRHMQLPARYSRPKQKGVLQWAQVQAAVAAGCHTCKDILQHISTQHQQQHTAAQAQAHAQQPRRGKPDSSGSAATAGVTAAGAVGAASGQQVIVPVVSREHLQRQLKAWVEEGRLIKAARNCFTLPEEPA